MREGFDVSAVTGVCRGHWCARVMLVVARVVMGLLDARNRGRLVQEARDSEPEGPVQWGCGARPDYIRHADLRRLIGVASKVNSFQLWSFAYPMIVFALRISSG